MKKSIFNMLHNKCRNSVYPSSDIKRFVVPDDKITWNIEFPNYSPIEYNSKVLQGKLWSDSDINDKNFKPQWNNLDGNVNRISFVCQYQIDKNNYPLNPVGRTGIKGRGLLGRWGPNHAADPIVSRWKKNSNKSILQFVGIQRKDTGEWAIPGGMVDPGEKITTTLRREFMEEALNSMEKNSFELKHIEKKISDFFDKGVEIYKGYVDDPRNTDNAWMETIAFNFHDSTDEIVGSLDLQAGDDAKNVRWIDISNELLLYASHKDLIKKVAEQHNAYW